MSSVHQRIVKRIRDSGPLSFEEVMADALYGEQGYYTRETFPGSPGGDFVTGSRQPLFARATARLLRRLEGLLEGEAAVLEVGCGDGAHLSGMVEALGGVAEGRVVACDRVRRPLPAGVGFAADLEHVLPLRGLIFSYELFDALPVRRFVGEAGQAREVLVGLDGAGDPTWVQGEVESGDLLPSSVREALVDGQVVDWAPGWAPLYRKLADRLERGLLVTFDYGYERARLLDPRRRGAGSLAAYRDHRVHRNVLASLGEQDLTAHVDFTLLREVGESRGLRTVAFARQAEWLVAVGIFDELQGAPTAVRAEAMALLDPTGMGHDLRVLVQARDLDPAPLFDVPLGRS